MSKGKALRCLSVGQDFDSYIFDSNYLVNLN